MGTLRVFFANVEQCALRAFNANDFLSINGGHLGELSKIFGLAIGIRSDIRHNDRRHRRRDYAAQAGARNAFDAANAERGTRQACACRTSGKEALRLPFFHQLAADHNGGIFLFAHRFGRMFGHANDLGRDCGGAAVVRACERLHDIGGPQEHDLQVLVFGESGGNTIEHNGRRIIAAHGIDCDGNVFG